MKTKFYLYTIFAFFCCIQTVLATGNSSTIDQSTAQINNANLNFGASDDSMEAATNSAMKAVMNVAALNIPGAIYNGYKGYSEYTNSERLDELELKNKYLRNKMRSNGSNGASLLASKPTTFSRLNKDFLYKGEMNDTASEFEKKSGMSREDFFNHLSSATDSDISWEDPDLQQKLEARFEAFTAAIPNKEFSDGLKKAANLVPNAQRVQILGELFAKYESAWGGDGGAAYADAGSSNIAPPVATSEQPQQQVANNPIAPEPNVNREIANTPTAYQENDMGLYIGIEGNPKDLADLLGANSSKENLSIFQIVNKKYRDLTPRLTGASAL
ncbi:MAG: hypothetical protein M9962_05515 [Oligoflexia bacterium]|nr:hypothetical protein [Oligoflexia bacterium]